MPFLFWDVVDVLTSDVSQLLTSAWKTPSWCSMRARVQMPIALKRPGSSP